MYCFLLTVFCSYIWVFDLFRVTFCICWEVQAQIHSFLCRHPAVAEQFVENIILSSMEWPGNNTLWRINYIYILTFIYMYGVPYSFQYILCTLFLNSF